MAAQLLAEGNSACKIDPFMPLHPIRDIPPHALRTGGRDRRDPDRYMLAQLHDPAGQPGTAAQDAVQGAAALRERLHHAAERGLTRESVEALASAWA
ncbi:MAG: hypothetical protein ACE5EF_05615 [Dehalococcoidia bacterium]